MRCVSCSNAWPAGLQLLLGPPCHAASARNSLHVCAGPPADCTKLAACFTYSETCQAQTDTSHHAGDGPRSAGEHLNVKEVHYNQHGLLLLAGKGIYRLGQDWYPVQVRGQVVIT